MHDDQEGETHLGKMIIDFINEQHTLRITEKILKLLKEKNKNALDLIEKMGLEKFRDLVISSDPRDSEKSVLRFQENTPLP